MHDGYLIDEEVDNWEEFWSTAQHVMFTLGMKLEDAGFGYSESKKVERKKLKGDTKPKK